MNTIACKNVPDRLVLRLALLWRFDPENNAPVFDALRDHLPSIPGKVLLRKIDRLVDRGLLEYGVSPYCSWPTPEGERLCR